MANKYALRKNTNNKSTAFGKYYVRPIYDRKFVDLEEVADFIQEQATVKRSDCKAVIDELGAAIQHFLGQGRKVRIKGLGIFKPTISSKGIENLKDFEPSKFLNETKLWFAPETETFGKKRIPKATMRVSWELADVAIDSNGEPLVGRKEINAAKGITPSDGESGGEG